MAREKQILSAYQKLKEKLGSQEHTFMCAAIWADSHPHWISVKDKKPKLRHSIDDMQYSAKVIVTDGEYCTAATYEHNEWAGWYGWFDGDEELKGITHWMPLPSIEHLKEKEL